MNLTYIADKRPENQAKNNKRANILGCFVNITPQIVLCVRPEAGSRYETERPGRNQHLELHSLSRLPVLGDSDARDCEDLPCGEEAENGMAATSFLEELLLVLRDIPLPLSRQEITCPVSESREGNDISITRSPGRSEFSMGLKNTFTINGSAKTLHTADCNLHINCLRLSWGTASG
jgi:hypothetical protein